MGNQEVSEITNHRIKKKRHTGPNDIHDIFDVGEQIIISFLSTIPERLTIECVCKRWRQLSYNELPLYELDFTNGNFRPISKPCVKMMLARGNGNLRRLVLPDVALDDGCVEYIMKERQLQFIRAHRLSKQHVAQIAQSCQHLESLELLECHHLMLGSWSTAAARPRNIFFNACHSLRNRSVQSLIMHCGSRLKNLKLTGATYVESSILSTLANHATNLESLTVTHCSEIRFNDLDTLWRSRWDTLSWLDISFCNGITSLPEHSTLPSLQVLLLDKTCINDKGLHSITRIAPELKYLSLQDCRNVTDNGIFSIAAPDGCIKLKLIDLKGDRVTDDSVVALETNCMHLRTMQLDSCRYISRELRLKYGKLIRDLIQRDALNDYESFAIRRNHFDILDEMSSEGSDNETSPETP